jgi:hypothetical protein
MNKTYSAAAIVLALGLTGVAHAHHLPDAAVRINLLEIGGIKGSAQGEVARARVDPEGSYISCTNSVFSDTRKDSIRCIAHDKDNVTFACRTVRGASNVDNARFNRMSHAIGGINRTTRIHFTANRADQCETVHISNAAEFAH